MGIIGWIGLGWEVIKLIVNIIRFIRELKKSDPLFKAAETIQAVNAGIKEYKATGDKSALQKVELDLKERCSGVGCPADLVR